MSKIILIITILSTFMVLTIPNFPAIEYKICLNKNYMQNFIELEKKEFSIDEKLKNLKKINFIEIRRVIKNIDVDILKGKILYDIKNSELTEKQKLSVERLFTSQKFINILIKGIIIPIILYTFVYRSIKIIPNAIGLLSIVIIGWIVPQRFIYPISNDIQEKTGIPWYISFLILAIIDNTLAYFISIKLISI